MKKNSPFLFASVAGICLLGIGVVVLTNYLQHIKPLDIKKEISARVLGETQSNIQLLIQTGIETSKDVVTQKAMEVEKTIITNIQKEIATLTKSQVELLKLQICRDLGVITPIPTKLP